MLQIGMLRSTLRGLETELWRSCGATAPSPTLPRLALPFACLENCNLPRARGALHRSEARAAE